MDGCLKLNLMGRYALSAAVFLTWKFKNQSGETNYFPLSALARAQRIPKPFLAQIVQVLVKAGLLCSKKGIHGGVTLSRDPNDITLLELMETCEGSYSRSSCIYYPWKVCAGKECLLFCPLRSEEEILKNRLGKITLRELACSLENHPERIGNS